MALNTGKRDLQGWVPRMEMQADYIELVEKARGGDRQSLNQLAAVARERLRTYVYRLTLKEDLTQEIVHESMLEMCRLLAKHTHTQSL